MLSPPPLRVHSKVAFLLLFVTSHCTCLSAQLAGPRLQPLTVSDGMAENSAQAFLQDHLGYMWIGTQHGLHKFDGYDFTVYQHIPGDSTSLPSSSILLIQEDENNDLWVALRNDGFLFQFSRFDRGAERFTTYRPSYSSLSTADSIAFEEFWNSGVSRSHLVLDRKTGIWLASRSMGLAHLDFVKNEVSFFRSGHEDGEGLLSDQVARLAVDKEGTLFIAYFSGAVSTYRSHLNQWNHYSSPSDSLSLGADFEVRNVWEKNNRLWVEFKVGRQGRLTSLDLEEGAWKMHVGYELADFYGPQPLIDDQNNIWFMTNSNNKRLGFIEEQNGHTTWLKRHPENPVMDLRNVKTLYEDAAGMIWLGQQNFGILRLDRYGDKISLIETTEPQKGGFANAAGVIQEDGSGRIWMITADGLMRFNAQTKQVERDFGTKRTLQWTSAIETDRQGNIWIGAKPERDANEIILARFGKNDDKATLHSIPFARLSSWESPGRILMDQRGDLWIGGSWRKGLLRYHPDSRELQRFSADASIPGSLSNNFISAIFEDSKGYLWCGTSGYGVDRYDSATASFNRFALNPDGLIGTDYFVSDIHEDGLGRLWLASFGGLYLLDREKGSYQLFTTRDGLAQDVVYQMEEDRSGNLWLMHESSVARVRFSDGPSPAIGEVEVYDQTDGLQDGRLSAYSMFQASDGQIYMGGTIGVNFFHPDSMSRNPTVPPLAFTGFEIGGKTVEIEANGVLPQHISMTTDIVLDHNQNDISLKFAALHYSNTERNLYSFRLEPYDKDWTEPATGREAIYTNLDPGQYVFHVKGSNSDGVWNEEGIQMNITILPPWWATWWAYLLYGAGTLGILYEIRRRELHRQAQKLAREQEKLEQQQRINAVTSKFVPNAFIQSLGRKDIMEVQLGDAVAQEVTVMFSDIRDYTSLSENMSPEENFQFVTAFNRRMGPVIQQNRGFVNQYLGDAIMALFKDTPADCLKAAIQMQRTLANYNRERKDQGLANIQLGIGLHTGPLIMGIIGDDQRMDAATISDTVNTASRIEGLTKYFKVNILLSGESLEEIQSNWSSGYHVRYLGQVLLKGKKEPTAIYECFDGDSPNVLEKKIRSQRFFEEGMNYYLSRDFAEAVRNFREVSAIDPTDQTAQMFLEKANQLIDEGVPKNWTGVEVMSFK